LGGPGKEVPGNLFRVKTPFKGKNLFRDGEVLGTFLIFQGQEGFQLKGLGFSKLAGLGKGTSGLGVLAGFGKRAFPFSLFLTQRPIGLPKEGY